MAYAQTNYPQIQGINGRYTIHDIGCFLTAFCNLLARWGSPIDPLSLNNIFRDRGIYVDVDDGIRDDLAWSSITQFIPEVTVSSTGGAGVPPHANTIVKFVYTSSRTGRQTTHFSLVDRIEGNVVYIIDSWDGVVKNASVYGGVKAYATYQLKEQPPQGGGNMAENKKTDLKVMQAIATFHGRNPNDPGNIDDLNRHHLGKDPYDKVLEFYNSQPGVDYRASVANAFAQAALVPALTQQAARVPDLERQITELRAQLRDRQEGNGQGATPKQIAAEKAMDAIKEYTKL